MPLLQTSCLAATAQPQPPSTSQQQHQWDHRPAARSSGRIRDGPLPAASSTPRGLQPFYRDQRPQVCRAHLYFGQEARTCKPWCRWPKKGDAKMEPSSRRGAPVDRPGPGAFLVNQSDSLPPEVQTLLQHSTAADTGMTPVTAAPHPATESLAAAAPPSTTPTASVNAATVDAADLHAIAEAQRDDQETAAYSDRLTPFPPAGGQSGQPNDHRTAAPRDGYSRP
ncbi:hypothetical protein FJT64_012542 [Amphibalanus amphitrite]|uniref:Uncharacterized protein n=1 Tax=Amphibalanus amphitrite TaxID=1232801 RepID=A0A6A4V624_AMPAM|nr:hypothetical protein FJT64_012542 [Amphibalanus amphitrite]